MIPLLHCQVRLVGLQSKPELNQQVGHATSFDANAERYEVKLVSSDQVVRVRERNLRQASQEKVTNLDLALAFLKAQVGDETESDVCETILIILAELNGGALCTADKRVELKKRG